MFETTNIQVIEGYMWPAGKDIGLSCFSSGISSGLMMDNSVFS